MAQISDSIKKSNRSNIYRRFLEGVPLTKQNLVSSLHLCLPTVTKNIEELLSEGLIFESGLQKHTGGRGALTYSLVKDARVALGIDISGNHFTIVVVDLTGTVINYNNVMLPYEQSESFFSRVGELLQALITDTGLEESQILGVGIGLPALVDTDRNNIYFSEIIDLSGTTYEDLSKQIHYPIRMFNDANASIFTEIAQYRNEKNIFYLSLSNNIGGSAMINGKFFSGDTKKSCEVGHITLVPGGKKCYCEQKGCVETYLAATNLSKLTGGNLQLFFDELKSGKTEFNASWNQYLDYLASTVNIVHNLFDCDIILGGYVGNYLEPYIDDLRQRAQHLNSFQDNADYLKLCSCKKEPIATGAALNFIIDFIKSV